MSSQIMELEIDTNQRSGPFHGLCGAGVSQREYPFVRISSREPDVFLETVSDLLGYEHGLGWPAIFRGHYKN
jgi:hypothetical protein